jgi:Pyridoxamine 5'-phosphate oxidase
VELAATDARARLAAHDHGVLCTVHPVRGADAVPCVYATDGDLVGVPIDTVKAKSASPLQRERNLAADPRATLLVEHWDRADWSALWWVRASLLASDAPPDALAGALAAAFPQYRDRPFARILVFRVVDLTGWSA